MFESPPLYQSQHVFFCISSVIGVLVQLDFRQFSMTVVLQFSFNFDKVVREGEPCLPTSPS